MDHPVKKISWTPSIFFLFDRPKVKEKNLNGINASVRIGREIQILYAGFLRLVKTFGVFFNFRFILFCQATGG